MSESLQKALDKLPANDSWGVLAADMLLCEAWQLGCSDLHLSSRPNGVLARGRRMGTLIPLAQAPPGRRELLVARLKVLARLPSFVRQEPQDGRIEWLPDGSPYPLVLRVSFLPTTQGESILIRFPDAGTNRLGLDDIGLPGELKADIERVVLRQEGTFFLTGPSGCGKTTTIYALLDFLHRTAGDRLNFLTIEDPVERDLEFADQVPVNESQGVTFRRALRSALRHDPDVILIGEIRDEDSASIAMQAGMTGHLVFSTLHAGRAAQVFTRLLSMRIEPYLIASALTAALAQRLARVLCPKCRVYTEALASHTAPGCGACGGTGFDGRTGIFEMIVVTEVIREMILSKATPGQLAREIARTQKDDLARHGQALLLEGRISRAELDYLLTLE